MLLNRMTINFPKDFEHYLRTTHGLSTNVLLKDIQFVKKIVTLAFKSGIIRHHPFAEHTVKKELNIFYYSNWMYLYLVLLLRLASILRYGYVYLHC